jgi:hypothetical protein
VLANCVLLASASYTAKFFRDGACEGIFQTDNGMRDVNADEESPDPVVYYGINEG